MAKKFCIYTVNTSGYDSYPKFRALDPEIELFIFTDDEKSASAQLSFQGLKNRFHIINCRELGEGIDTMSAQKLSRYIKMNPHLVVGKEYDYAVYFDSSFDIKRLSTRQIEDFHESNPIAFLKHPRGGSTLEEARAIMKLGYFSEIEMTAFLSQESLSFESLSNFPLAAGGFFSVQLKDFRAIQFLDEWWALYNRFGGRDQLYLGLAASRAKVRWDSIDVDYLQRNPMLYGRGHLNRGESRPRLTVGYILKALRFKTSALYRKI